MFCKNCGTELTENAEFCTHCGKKINEEQNVTKATVIINKNWLLPVFAIVLVSLLAFILFKPSRINSSPEKVAAATVESEYEVDIDTMMECFPDFIIKELAADAGLPEGSKRSAVAEEIKKDYRYTKPQEVEIMSTEIVNVYTTDEYTIFRELYDYLTDEEYRLITSIAKVNVNFKVDAEEKSIVLTCIEMDDEWYFLRGLK